MKPLTIGGAVLLLLCAAGGPAEAQAVASTFDQLTVLVKPGDKISVVDVTGREAEGRLATLSRDALILTTEAGPRKLLEADVARIRQRRGDSLRNGAIIGAVAGAAYGAILLALANSIDEGDVLPGSAVGGMVIFTGLGAAAGAGIDALIASRHVIYQKPVGRKVGISPLLGFRRQAVAVSVKF